MINPITVNRIEYFMMDLMMHGELSTEEYFEILKVLEAHLDEDK
jgi:hypothetical protein